MRPTRWFAAQAHPVAGRPADPARGAGAAPDLVVSTYPGTTEVLGDLRAKGRIDVPVVSAITDLAALRFWAHPGVDLHLITHPESAEEVRGIAPGSGSRCVRGLTDRALLRAAPTRRRRGAQLGPAGGRAGGDRLRRGLGGRGPRGRGRGGAGGPRRDRRLPLRPQRRSCAQRSRERFADEPRVRVEGFTERMPDWFAAADVLVHSTAGLTVLEAIMSGCGVVSYGWGTRPRPGEQRGLHALRPGRGRRSHATSSAPRWSGRWRASPDARRVTSRGCRPAASVVARLLGLADGELGDRGRAREQAGAQGHGH